MTYDKVDGSFDLAKAKDAAIIPQRIVVGAPETAVGDFSGAFAASPIQLDPAALMGELAVDERHGFFVNRDLAGYEVPVHADVPHQDVIFLDETDPTSSPMKAKGVDKLISQLLSTE